MTKTRLPKRQPMRSKAGAALLLLATLGMAPVAQAQYATGGTGRYLNQIFWVDWGNDGQNLFPGPQTITRGFNVDTPASAANRLDITCTASNITTASGVLTVYTPGTWQGDGLDNLYNIGGSQNGQNTPPSTNPNTLSVGLSTSNGGIVDFDFTCSATLGGQPLALAGLVYADAESSSSTNEYVRATLTSGGTMRVIDQISQCGINTIVQVSGATTTFLGPGAPTGTPNNCEVNPNTALRAGPVLVGFLDGATSGRIGVKGGGRSAVGVGAFLTLEFSEAIPSTYGNAVHVLQPTFTGGVATAGTNYNTNTANLAVLQFGPHLGPTVDPVQNAAGAVGGPDVDALPKTTGPAGAGYANVPLVSTGPGTTYTIANVQCIGQFPIAGWIDFNGNGTFDTGERSAIATCPTTTQSSVSLSWTIPADYKAQPTSYMRLRMAETAAGLASARGVASRGEAEDYRLVLPQVMPTVTLAKVSTGGVGTFSFTGTNGVPAQTLTTTAAGTAVTGTPASLTAAATQTVITEAATAGFTLTGITCTGMSAGGTATVNLPSRSVTLNAAATGTGANITCTFTNAASVDLAITKTNNRTESVSGQPTTYVVTVTNNGTTSVTGGVVRDTPQLNLTCPAGNVVTCTGPAGACPTSGLTVGTLTSAGGLTLGTLAAGASLTLQFTCTVN